jgi:hypothetical protein
LIAQPGMKELKSFFAIIGLVAIAFVALHHLILLLGLPELVALILLAMPVIIVIAYTTNETPTQMYRSAISIFAWFVAVVLGSSALVWFID